MRYLLVLAALTAAAAAAQDWIEAPSGGEAMLPADSTVLRGTGSLARYETVPVEGMPFTRALKATISTAGRNPWDVQIFGATTGEVKQGDVIWISLFARGTAQTETGEATGTAYLQRSAAPNEKLVTMPFSVGPEWRQFMLPATASLSLPNGQHQLTIFLGYAAQSIEIGGVAMVNYRTSRTVSQLPRTKTTWAGSAPDAPWRAEADATIDAIRKADVKVMVRNAAGQPVSGAAVRVRMKSHEFGFGSAVDANTLAMQNSDGERYREVVRTWFNKVVLENDLKWPNWESNRQRALNALEWFRENGISQLRGHNLIWPSWRYMPSGSDRLAGDPDALRKRINDHFDDILSATHGQLAEWDVLNEAWTNADVQKVLGDDEMAEWFKRARALDANALLYINDYSILSNGGTDKAHQDGFYNQIAKLIEQGAPVDGIGMQGHFGGQLTAPVRVWQILDRFAQFGRRIQITEFDIDTEDEEVQAAYTRDFMTAVFSHPQIDGFMMWGFWAGKHWRPSAAMFRRDWTMKPNASVFHDLVFRQWWTDVTGTTNENGEFTTRGFKGEYDVEVNGIVQPFRLEWRGAQVELTLR